MTWCDRFSLSCRSESKFECTQADSTISASRHRLWMCVCGRVQTSRHEDEIWMTQMKAFLSLVPLNVGPSVESRGLDSTLGAVSVHCCSASFPMQDVLLEELHKESNVSRCDCGHDCSGSRWPTRTHVARPSQWETELTRSTQLHRNSLRKLSMWCADFRACRLRIAASERKANICRLNLGALVSICNWLDTHESRNCLRGSSV